MACNSPMYRIELDEATCKKLPRRYKKRLRGNGFIMDRKEYEYFRDCLGIPEDKLFSIPCGKCLGCKTDYQNVWSTRAFLESTLYKDNYFVTLTYNDENIPKMPVINDLTGEISSYDILVKSDFSSFIKRLRERLRVKDLPSPRFLACGEYGDNGKRPHFHFLGFNLVLEDLEYFYSKGKKGFHVDYKLGDEIYYRSKIIEECWGKGFCLVAKVNPQNCVYVASYCNKQVTPKQAKLNAENKSIIERFNSTFGTTASVDSAIALSKIPSPFLHMSRRPGLASDFFDKKQLFRYYKYDGLTAYKGFKPFKRIIRYFDNKIKNHPKYSVVYDIIKDRRKKLYYQDNWKQWDNSDWIKMQIKEELLQAKAKNKKKRSL